MLLVSREWQATARKTSCLQKRDSGNIPLNRADVSSRNFDSLAGFGAIFPRYHRSGINIIFKSVSPEQPWCAKEPFSAPFFSFTVYDFFFVCFSSFQVMPQICPPGLFILLAICSSWPAPILVGLKGWRQHGACLGCSGETSQRRDRVLLTYRFRLGLFSLCKLTWLREAFWKCFVMGDLGAW